MAAMEGTRRQAASPVDQTAARKALAPSAWKGTNPITQRPSNPTTPTPNGVATGAKPAQQPRKTPAATSSSPSRAGQKESNTADQHAHDRLAFLLANFIGLSATVTLRNRERYSGIFSGSSLDGSEARYVLKMVKRLEPHAQEQPNGIASDEHDEYIGQGDDHVMVFEVQDVADLSCTQVSTAQHRPRGANGVAASFKTDTDISGNLATRERDLQRWEPSEDVSAGDMSLGSGNAGGWDQFAANKSLYNVTSDYDEEMYTTKIDRSRPGYAKVAAEADRKVREIEASSAMNAHVAEERGGKALDDSGMDEEEKYSGVKRDYAPLPSSGPNKYTPPARRGPNEPASQIPNDPAILAAKPATPTAVAAKEASKAPEGANGKPAPVATAVTALPSAKAAPSTTDGLKGGPIKGDRKAADTSKRGVENATDTVERDLMDAFKQFANNEKAMLKNHQRDRQNKDKQMKINELRKFAHNFKLNTPVPPDLVPILAKDEKKQKDIMEKAKQAAEEVKSIPPKPPAPSTGTVSDPKVPRAGASQQMPPTPVDRVSQTRRPGQNNYPPASFRGDPRVQGPGAPQRPGQLSQRLTTYQQQHRAGMQMPALPGPTPIQIPPPQGPSAMHAGMQSPGSAASTRFNAGAREFKPNPAANTFSPSISQQSNSSSPRHADAQPRPVSKGLSDFWEGHTPPAPKEQHPPLTDFFNAIPRMQREAENDPKKKEYEVNGGIPQAYRTNPGWDVPEANQNVTYAQMFEKIGMSVGGPPIAVVGAPHMMMQPGVVGGHMGPQGHQMPMHHLQQNGPMMQQQPGGPQQGNHHTPHHTPRNMHAQPQGGQHPNQQGGQHHFDDNAHHHRMQFTQSQQSGAAGMHPSPRPIQQFMVANGPHGPQQVQMFQPMAAATAAAYGMPTVMHPGQQGMALRGGGPGGPQHHFVPQQGQHGGMVQPGAGGPYIQMGGGPVGMYGAGGFPSPQQQQGQQQNGGGPNGYPSPRAGMMQHSASQQGGMPPGQPMMYIGGQMQGMPMFAGGVPGGPMTPMRGPYPGNQGGSVYGTSPHQHQGHFPQHQHQQHSPHRGTPSATYAQPHHHQQHHHNNQHQQQGQGRPNSQQSAGQAPPPPAPAAGNGAAGPGDGTAAAPTGTGEEGK